MNPTKLIVVAVLLCATSVQALENAKPIDPARAVQPNVPKGKITSGTFADSKFFPGTRREFSVYVPAQYKPETSAALMVFMDGPGYMKADGPYRVPVVFDNLIHEKAMPVTIAVFVTPAPFRLQNPARRIGAIVRSSTIR